MHTMCYWVLYPFHLPSIYLSGRGRVNDTRSSIQPAVIVIIFFNTPRVPCHLWEKLGVPAKDLQAAYNSLSPSSFPRCTAPLHRYDVIVDPLLATHTN
jgi:hypothetical protein